MISEEQIQRTERAHKFDSVVISREYNLNVNGDITVLGTAIDGKSILLLQCFQTKIIKM
jgi:hypothetical protein